MVCTYILLFYLIDTQSPFTPLLIYSFTRNNILLCSWPNTLGHCCGVMSWPRTLQHETGIKPTALPPETQCKHYQSKVEHTW